MRRVEIHADQRVRVARLAVSVTARRRSTDKIRFIGFLFFAELAADNVPTEDE